MFCYFIFLKNEEGTRQVVNKCKAKEEKSRHKWRKIKILTNNTRQTVVIELQCQCKFPGNLCENGIL